MYWDFLPPGVNPFESHRIAPEPSEPVAPEQVMLFCSPFPRGHRVDCYYGVVTYSGKWSEWELDNAIDTLQAETARRRGNAIVGMEIYIDPWVGTLSVTGTAARIIAL